MKTIFLAKDVEKCSFVVFFGTQLGNAGSIAESVIEIGKSSLYNWTTVLYSLNQIKDINELAQVRCPIIIITSTTGDGEPPENADRFWRQLHKKSLISTTLSSIKYTLLGLGDTNFNTFCNCGKQIHKRFQELGAQLFYSPGWADDAVGIELVVDGWIENLWPALKQLIENSGEHPKKPFVCKDSDVLKPLQGENQDTIAMDLSPIVEGRGDGDTLVLTLPACPQVTLSLEYMDSSSEDLDLINPPTPYPLLGGPITIGKVLSAKCLTKQNAVKTAIEITLQAEEQLNFEPGDAIGIVCPNSYAEVELLLDRLGVKGKADKCIVLSIKTGIVKGKFPVHIPKTKTTLRNVFMNYCDIRTTPKKAFVRLLAENTSDVKEKNILLHLCSKEGSTNYEETLRSQSLSILDILLKFSSCQPPLEAVLENLPRLIPRAYSISSSPLQSNTTFTIAFNIIHIPKENGRQYCRSGVCTGWLYEIAEGMIVDSHYNDKDTLKCLSPIQNENITSTNKILFYKRKNHNFRLPSDLTAPVIMVGPGTGVAPFIGFLQHRQLQKERGEEIEKLYLYFGCRHKERDFLYEDTLKNLHSDGILTKLNVSFSRDQVENNSKYVQDNMFLNKEEIVKTILDNNGYIYVCGDANNMAKNVRDKLVVCIQDVKGISEKEALGHIANLVLSKRYLQDIW